MCLRPWLFTLFALAAVGCYPVTHLQGPRTVAPAELQVATAVGLQKPTGLPLDVAVRIGVHDRADVSFRLRPALFEFEKSVVELGGKVQLARGDFELSIAPSFATAMVKHSSFDDENVTPDERAEFLFGRVSLIAGTNADDVGSIWIAPTIDCGRREFRVSGVWHSAPLLALGSAAGIALRLGPHAQLLLQGGLSVGVAGQAEVVEAGNTYSTILGPGDVLGEVTLGILLGGFHD